MRASILTLCWFWLAGFGAAQPLVVPYLETGRLLEAETALLARLGSQPEDAEAQFSLGVVQFLGAFEGASQSFARYGLRTDDRAITFLPFQFPSAADGNAREIAYGDLRAILATFLADLGEASATFAALSASLGDGEVKLELPVGRIRLDFDGDGDAGEDESLQRLFARFGQPSQVPLGAGDLPIAFDRGDVHWFRGYAELLSALTEIYLAHDSRDLFERTAHLTYEQVRTPHEFLGRTGEPEGVFDITLIADLIAFIHLLSLEPTEPERLERALEHLETVLSESRRSWDAIRAETDDEREWIPNAAQSSVIGVRLTEVQIEAWLTFLDEADTVLAGDLLIPHPRVRDGRGVNVRRVFMEPRTFDAVLWFQGSAATPYLEEGPLTSADTWRRLQGLFGGNFLNFALWFN